MRLFAVASSLVLITTIASPALAESGMTATAAHDSAAQVSAKPDKAKKICRKTSSVTGSRLAGSRICRTAEQWAELESRDTELGRVAGVRAVPPPPAAGPGR